MAANVSFADLERQKAALLADLEKWPPDRLHQRPGPGQWSAAEVVDHIVRTESEILDAVKKGLGCPRRIGILDKARTRFLESLFRSDRKVKVPSEVTSILPGSNLTLGEIAQRWSRCRCDLAQVLERQPPETIGKGVFQHPVGGWMDLPEVLNFFSVHIIHHNYQLARLLA